MYGVARAFNNMQQVITANTYIALVPDNLRPIPDKLSLLIDKQLFTEHTDIFIK